MKPGGFVPFVVFGAVRGPSSATTHSTALTARPSDDKFVACALAGDAGYVITLDKDILALRALEDVRMVTPDEFLAMLQDAR
jgi:predicted nucleic acid-binding protein